MAGLQQLVDDAVVAALEKFAPLNLRADELAVTLIDLRDSPAFSRACPEGGEGRGEISPNPFLRFESSNRSGDQSRTGVPPVPRARQREQTGGGAAEGRRDACPTLEVHGEEADHSPINIPSPRLGGERESEAMPEFVHHRGDAPVYPASVVKLFYLVAAHQQMADGKISDTPELRRALHDMIVHSGNESTGYVLDVLTGTTSGPELPPAELAAWGEKRNAVNRYFQSLGYTGINVNRKTWNEGPYGRDKQAVDQLTPAKNFLTSNATARLLVEIDSRQCVSAARSAQMLELMKRDFTDPSRTDKQACEFIGAVLPAAAKLWSKAGYMSVARHDAALVELPGGGKLALVIFTTRPDEKEIIPAIARQIVSGLEK